MRPGFSKVATQLALRWSIADAVEDAVAGLGLYPRDAGDGGAPPPNPRAGGLRRALTLPRSRRHIDLAPV